MAPRLRKIQLYALNLTTHPHPQGVYVEILRRAVRLKVVGKMRTDRSALILRLQASSEHVGCYSGVIGSFTGIDKDHPWINLKTSEPADENELSEVVIPPHLQPNFERIDFVFHEPSHTMIVREQPGAAPRSVARALESILNNDRMGRKKSPLRVTIVQDHETLTRIKRAHLTVLDLMVEMPNPDSLGDSARSRVYEKMQKRNARRQKEVVTGDGVVFDDELRDLAEVALTDGRIKAKGHDPDGTPVNLSTADHPIKHVEMYDPATEREDKAWWRTVLDFLGILKK